MYWRISFPTTLELAPDLGGALEPYVMAVSWYEGERSLPQSEKEWIVEATHNEEPDPREMQGLVDAVALLLGIKAPLVTVEKLPDTDWLEATWKNFPPREIGRFYVYGSHVASQIPEGLIGLEVNAATAFGSGEHETTTGCLLTLQKLADSRAFKKPLDMGCGSGILAMAAAKIFEHPVLAVDNDPESVRVTLGNAQMNNCAEQIEALCSEGFSDPVIQQKGPFDLILANILAKPLCLMAQDMVKNITDDGYIILSGLLKRQQEEVVEAYKQAGAELVDALFIGEWATLLLRRAAQ